MEGQWEDNAQYALGAATCFCHLLFQRMEKRPECVMVQSTEDLFDRLRLGPDKRDMSKQWYRRVLQNIYEDSLLKARG